MVKVHVVLFEGLEHVESRIVGVVAREHEAVIVFPARVDAQVERPRLREWVRQFAEEVLLGAELVDELIGLNHPLVEVPLPKLGGFHVFGAILFNILELRLPIDVRVLMGRPLMERPAPFSPVSDVEEESLSKVRARPKDTDGPFLVGHGGTQDVVDQVADIYSVKGSFVDADEAVLLAQELIHLVFANVDARDLDHAPIREGAIEALVVEVDPNPKPAVDHAQDVLHDDVERSLPREPDEEAIAPRIRETGFDHVETGGEGLSRAPGAVERLMPRWIVDELPLLGECALSYGLKRVSSGCGKERFVD